MAGYIKFPGDYCFVGNPMVFELEVNSPDPVDVIVSMGSEKQNLTYTPYGKTSPYRVQFDVANILQSFIGDKTVTITKGDIIHTVDNFAFDCQVSIEADRTSSFTLHRVFRGGISNKTISGLSTVNRDMFTYRLANPVYNPLFTTRTNGHNLVLRETELYPFVFIHPGTPVSFVTIGGRVITQAALEKGTICSMDFEAVRQMFAGLYGELPSYIVVQFDHGYSFDLTITPAQISEERSLLLFRNSIGAFEVMEVTGKASNVPEFAEENLWNTLNSDDYFDENRDRLILREKIGVESGYKTQAELNFIKDLIASDAIYYLDGDIQFRCHVTADQVKIARRQVIPNSIPLVIRQIMDEQYHTPEIDFSFPENIPLSNITRASDTRINGEGLIFGDDNFLYAE